MLIPLNQNRVVEIDDADAPLILQYRWTASRTRDGLWYVMTCERDENGKRHSLLMHRLICGLSRGDPRHVDHVDGDGLNNTRANLRLATVAENAWNRRKRKALTSKFKGVSLRPETNLTRRWKASLCVNGRVQRLGDFLTEAEAAAAYNRAALTAFGERACLNTLP